MADLAQRVRVTGRVQGVFFRAWTEQQARELKVRGWVRNASDGSVEAQLEGEAEAVRALVERLRRGPPSARVESVESEECGAEGFQGFEVRH